ncbi:hypothetical protein ACA910_004554 [Epithemia clementina (nom. ined.)]
MMVGPATTTPTPWQQPKDPTTRPQRSPFDITPGLPGMGLQWAKQKRQRRPPQPQQQQLGEPLMAGNHAATMETTNTTIDNGDSADEKEEEEDVWMLSVQILGDNRHNQLRQVLEEEEQQQQQQGSSGSGFQITSCGTYRCHALMDLKRFPEIHGLPGVLAMEPNVVETSSSSSSSGWSSSIHSGRLQPQPDRFLAGLVRSEAYESLHVDQVRQRFGFTGTGLKIGILSDSFDLLRGYNRDVETGDLPDRDRMELVYEYPFFSATDEGRAMMQLLYDLLPNATFAFATGFVSPEDFAQNIQALANVGCDLIVDDVTWFTEPFFQHGVVAQSANDVAEIRGIPYFSAAGNYGRQSWQSPFVGSGILDDNGCELHAFGPPQQQQKQQLNQTITFAPQDRLVFQWADHFYSVNGPPGAQTDMNLQFYRRNGELYASFTADNVGIDPVILFTYSGEEEREEEEVNLQMTISHCSGPPPTWMKWLGNTGRSWFPSEFATDSPTLFGHKNTPFVAAVGAALYQNTPAFGTNPPVVQVYSSVGGLPLLYDRDGTPIGGRRTGRGRIYRQPRFVATHGVANTFFGPLDYKEPNGFAYYFFGTSAAAPNAAAVGALLLQANPELTPLELYRIMETTTIDMDKPGFDFETGFGFIDAYAAVSSLLFTTPSNAPTTANATTTAPAPTFVTATPTTTAAPTTETPTSSPTKMQTARPTKSPITPAPTSNPMDTPTTLRPTIFPPTTTEPSAPPTANPTWSPTSTPSFIPSVAPGTTATAVPTQFLDCPAVSACNDGTCGNCQQPRANETGCSCAGCECQVCALDPFCCESFWDGLCSITAMSLCRDCVNGGGNHDDTNNNAVSNVSAKTTMSSSTTTAATSTMTTTTLAPSTCFDTPSTCGPQEDDGSFSCGNCLDLRGNETGCSCPGCACRVCAMDSFCCNNFWDRQCVDTAQDICNCPNNINNV